MGGGSGGGDDAGAGGQQEGDAADFGDHVGISFRSEWGLAVGFSELRLAVVYSNTGMSGDGSGGHNAAAGREDQANSLQRLEHFGAPW
jgi:hypothetical protein